jgi:hypothetical protein
MGRLASVSAVLAGLLVAGGGTSVWADVQAQQFAVAVDSSLNGDYNAQLSFGLIDPTSGEGAVSVVFDDEVGTAQVGVYTQPLDGALSLSICVTNNGGGVFAVFVAISFDIKQVIDLPRLLPPATVMGGGIATNGDQFTFSGSQNGGPP